ncbi:MAG: peptidoglycan-binding domain-containing protein [Terrimicrobiaceae bacterium]|nr:peptidoglycan-binding protein [Terrimicrobiaceae bacterium]
MFPRLALALFIALLPVTLRADDTVLATQKKLAQLGFYNGGADGQMGSQTSAAIRRYQIAENLKVTGELNRQTLAQLGIKGSAPAPAYVAIAEIFKGGPYISVGPEMQVAVIRQAQKNLKLLGYYSGPEDGLPNGALVSALKIWQKSAGFRQTGRFDENSLKGLDLMPD